MAGDPARAEVSNGQHDAAEPWVERHWPPDDTEESVAGSEYHHM